MQKFIRTELNNGNSIKEKINFMMKLSKEIGHKIDRNGAKKLVNEMEQQEIWVNDLYQVNILRGKDCDEFIHIEDFKGKCDYISIKTLDKEPIHDWRHFQEIKNELCGEDREAIEIYPSEKRLLDTSNQYHLFVLPKGHLVPFGFVGGRAVDYTERQGGFNKMKQRGLDE